jgi:hemerythrin-like domain-containing protein
MNAIELLKKDHATVKKILASIEKTTDRTAAKRESLLLKAKQELLVHEFVEETLVYPILKEHEASHDLALEAYEEHYFANMILEVIENTASDDETWLAKFSVFKENIQHHIKEEETKLFKLLKKILDKKALEALALEIKAAKKDYKKTNGAI